MDFCTRNQNQLAPVVVSILSGGRVVCAIVLLINPVASSGALAPSFKMLLYHISITFHPLTARSVLSYISHYQADFTTKVGACRPPSNRTALFLTWSGSGSMYRIHDILPQAESILSSCCI